MKFETTKKTTEACEFPLCAAPVFRRGFCSNHFKKWKAVQAVLKSPPEHGRVPYHAYHAVYVMTIGDMPYCKVGRSRDPMGRKETLQSGCPFEINIAGLVYGHPDVIMALEYQSLRTLKDIGLHKRGEWFVVAPEDAIAVVEKCVDIYGLPTLHMDKYEVIAERPDPSEILGWKPGQGDRVKATIAEARWEMASRS